MANESTGKTPPLTTLGVSGTKLFAGITSEEENPRLRGQQAFRTYQDMRFDAVGAALLKAVEYPIRSARWFVEPASQDPKHIKWADFIHDNLYNFGTQSMDELIRLAFTMLPFGFAWLETIYKYIETGDWAGKVGWDEFAWRSQATKWRWNMVEAAGRMELESVTQLAPPLYREVAIPRAKLLLFVHQQEGDNYDGWSMFRPGFENWFYRKALLRIQAVGLERTYMGIPKVELPAGFSDEEAALAKQIVETVRTDEQAGIIHPENMIIDVLHNSVNGPAMQAALQYHDTRFLLSCLEQFLLLGSGGQTGSFALSSDHSEMFLMALNGHANYFSQVMNLHPGIPTLCAYNFSDFDDDKAPKLLHGDIGQRAIDKLGRTLDALAKNGFLTPDDATEDKLRQMLDLPLRDASYDDRALFDLIQGVIPHQLDPRLEKPTVRDLPVALQAAADASPKGPLGKPPVGPPGAPQKAAGATKPPKGDSAAMSERRERLRELQMSRPWNRPQGRLTSETRGRIMATEAFAGALQEFQTDLGRVPERPSTRIAKAQRPYEIATMAELPRRKPLVRTVPAFKKRADRVAPSLTNILAGK